jgi:hypothetical protein
MRKGNKRDIGKKKDLIHGK